jgi:hypothetical protein
VGHAGFAQKVPTFTPDVQKGQLYAPFAKYERTLRFSPVTSVTVRTARPTVRFGCHDRRMPFKDTRRAGSYLGGVFPG